MLEQSTRIGEFEIIRLLGKGGMGEVYEAQQTHPERRVALKVLAPWLTDNEEALARFWREAEVPAKLDHPAVVRIYATGKSNGIAYYVMQLVQGISLARLIARSNEVMPPTQSLAGPAPEPSSSITPVTDVTVDLPVTPSNEPDLPILQEYRADRLRTLARLGIQAARALAWTHKKGYLHRDIKPSNIMVDHHNQLYLLDFGLTRALQSGETTRTGSVIGTPYFMSPEQAVGQPLDWRSDIFSLGVSLYQLASRGQGPYQASRDDSEAVMREVRAGELMPLRSLAPEVPPMLEAIIERAIDPRPKRRYQKAEELADDLEKFLSQSAAMAGAPFAQPGRWSGLRWLLAGAAVLVLLAVTAGGTYWYAGAPWRERPDKPDRGAEVNKPDANKSDPEKPIAAPTLRDFFKRDRPVKTEVKLLRADNQPTLYKQLLGNPTYTAMTKEIILFSRADNHRPGLLALDDPGEQNFEFAVEMRTWGINDPGVSELGLFFGWRENLADPLERSRFFAVQLDPRPDNLPHGRLTIGSWRFEEPMAGRMGMTEQNPRVLFSPKELKGIVPLPAPKDKKVPYYRVWVRVVDKKITVGVEDEQPVEFDVAWMMNNDKWLKTYTLDPHGALGIWTRNGQAFFRNPTIMALPREP